MTQAIRDAAEAVELIELIRERIPRGDDVTLNAKAAALLINHIAALDAEPAPAEMVEGYTPGPWKDTDACGLGPSGAFVGVDAVRPIGRNPAIAHVLLLVSDDESEARANARLIAQAPTLAEENKRLREVIGDAHAALEHAPEINPSNYSHDQVCDLNGAANEAFSVLGSAIAKAEKTGGDA